MCCSVDCARAAPSCQPFTRDFFSGCAGHKQNCPQPMSNRAVQTPLPQERWRGSDSVSKCYSSHVGFAKIRRSSLPFLIPECASFQGSNQSWQFQRHPLRAFFLVSPFFRGKPRFGPPRELTPPKPSEAEALIDSFSFRTAPSEEQLDPVEWRLEASNDQSTWKARIDCRRAAESP